jgi:hypothetical protein
VREFPDCSAALAALARGLDGQACHNFRGIREVVMCDAWRRARAAGAFTRTSFSQAVDDGWRDVRGACTAHGGTTPEYGFLQPGVAPPDLRTPGAPAEVAAVRRNGLTVGLITLEPGGAVHACLEDGCHELQGGQDTMDSLSALLTTAGYQVVADL